MNETGLLSVVPRRSVDSTHTSIETESSPDEAVVDSNGSGYFNPTKQPHNRNQGIMRSIGIFNFCLLLGGPLLSLIILGFLLFLRTGQGAAANGDEASHTWKMFIFNGWLLQTITISTLALRFCLAVPITICTSMVACLMLEGRALPVVQAASMSTHRSINGGLYGFMTQFLQRNMIRLLLNTEGLAICLLAVCAVALQFSSTLLLSDIDTPTMSDFLRSSNYTLYAPVHTDPETYTFPALGFDRAPELLAVFGESSDGYVAEPNNKGISDTGLKRHVMIPFSDNRTWIHELRGPALVMDSRVACMAPVMSRDSRITGGIPSINTTFEADIDFEKTIANAGIELDDRFAVYPAELHVKYKVVSPYSHLHMFDRHYVNFPTAGAPSYPSAPEPWINYMMPWQADPYLMLILDAEGPSPHEGINTLKSKGAGEWLHFYFDVEDLQSPFHFRLNASICFYNHNISIFDVDLVAESKLVEPRITWPTEQRNSSSLDEATRLLGLSLESQAPSDRGILTASDARSIQATSPTRMKQTLAAGEMLQRSIEETLLWTVSTFNNTADYTYQDMDPYSLAIEYQQMIDRAVRNTGRSSVAVQTFFTMLAQFCHDQMLLMPEISDGGVNFTGQVAMLSPKNVPKSFRGFAVVVVLFLVTVLCMAFITTTFARNSCHSLLDNFWYAIAQVVSPATAELLALGNRGVSDGEIERALMLRLRSRTEEGGERLVRLGRSPETGEMELLLVGSFDGDGEERDEYEMEGGG